MLVNICIYIGRSEVDGYGSCEGDSGGPLVYLQVGSSAERDKYIQLGIVQGGIGKCGDASFPAIYIRLEDKDVLDFVKEAIQITSPTEVVIEQKSSQNVRSIS